MILTHGINSLPRGGSDYGLPFPDGEPLVYNGKSYRTKRIKDLLMQVEFFNEAVYSYNEHNGIKYYEATDRFNVENLVSAMGWRLALDDDINFIKQEIDFVKDYYSKSYVELLGTQDSGWSDNMRGDNLTGIGMAPTGYYWSNSLFNASTWWTSWGGSHSTQGNGAVSFERYGFSNFGTGRNWADMNCLPIIFVKDV